VGEKFGPSHEWKKVRIRVFEKRVAKNIFVSKREEVSRDTTTCKIFDPHSVNTE
jgi:hypothetical protein